MEPQEAYRIYLRLREHVDRHWDEDGAPEALGSVRTVSGWRGAADPAPDNAFDGRLRALYGDGGQNTCSDTVCTVEYRGVLANVVVHYGCASAGLPFGFPDGSGALVVARCNGDGDDGFTIVAD